MSDVFSKIVSGELPCHKIYEDEHVLAFLDIHPKARGHTLVIPKSKSVNVLDIPLLDFQHVMVMVHRLAPKIVEAVGADGVNVIHSGGTAAQQDVPYFHTHILPRFENDSLNVWHSKGDQAEYDLEELAGTLRSELE